MLQLYITNDCGVDLLMGQGILSVCFSLKRTFVLVNASCKEQVKQITYKNALKDSVQTFGGNLGKASKKRKKKKIQKQLKVTLLAAQKDTTMERQGGGQH